MGDLPKRVDIKMAGIHVKISDILGLYENFFYD